MELIVTGISIVALIMAMGARKRLRRLEDRIAGLATGGQAAQPITPTIVAPSAEARLAAVEQPVRQDAAAEPAPTTEQPVPVAPAAEESASTALEKKFGTQWVVWIGGLALALGGIFLVRYTIEQGLLGPGVRVFLGAIFSALLIAAGEWARRNEIAAGITAIPTRHIPSILTAAGTVAAYATVYARFRALRFPVTGCRVYFAWSRSTCHLGSGIAARAGSCRTWSCRCLRYAAADCFADSELLGALCLSGHRHRRCTGARAAASLAMAGNHRRYSWHALDPAGSRVSPCR
jgi:Predicted membrane protein (DUF2339)